MSSPGRGTSSLRGERVFVLVVARLGQPINPAPCWSPSPSAWWQENKSKNRSKNSNRILHGRNSRLRILRHQYRHRRVTPNPLGTTNRKLPKTQAVSACRRPICLQCLHTRPTTTITGTTDTHKFHRHPHQRTPSQPLPHRPNRGRSTPFPPGRAHQGSQKSHVRQA